MPYLFALGIGVVAGLRTFVPIFALRWQARDWTTIVAGIAAVGEFVGDKLPGTMSRLSPPALGARLVVGAICGAVIAGVHAGLWPVGAIAGIVGALIGAYGGFAVRTRIAPKLRLPDWPVAVLEDIVALAGGFSIALAA